MHGLLQHLAAAGSGGVVLRYQKPHGGIGDPQVLQRCGAALLGVAGEQSLDILAPDPVVVYRGEFPGQILRVLYPGVQAPRAEWGEQVRSVPGQKHPPDLKLIGHPLVETVHRQPYDLVRSLPHDPANTRVQGTAGTLGGQIEIGGHLPIDPPH